MSADRDDVAGVFADWDARDARQAAEDGQRDRLATALVEGVGTQMPRGKVWNLDKATDALLPVVRALVAEGAAAELRAAAEDWEALVRREKPPIRGSVWLRARAAALTAGSEANR